MYNAKIREMSLLVLIIAAVDADIMRKVITVFGNNVKDPSVTCQLSGLVPDVRHHITPYPSYTYTHPYSPYSVS
jgi:hypothetical protein